MGAPTRIPTPPRSCVRGDEGILALDGDAMTSNDNGRATVCGVLCEKGTDVLAASGGGDRCSSTRHPSCPLD